ncbi:hypothetical protein O181_003353 [Austropuccinia psidii MF-1]|uniref:Uncharacterized protein n=1 Tax=Austropuccinia psidii MF-1 TaxID=1389203 RepID=A0A9Q3BEB1_9BASI|nr:hypothetical protein [Austropuccinia psidii MF-1]
MRKLLGHPNTSKLPNGWHPLMEKKNMILLTAEWRKKNPTTTQESAKNSPSSQKQQFKHEKVATSLEQGQRKSNRYKNLQPGLQNSKYSAGCHGKFISDGHKNDGITEKGGSHTKISEMISDILNGIPNLYIAINDMRSHISDENSSICKNLKTNSLSLSQMNEKLMCFEKVSRKIQTSNDENSFGNKLNEQSSIIQELGEKYSKFNIDDIIKTRIKKP